MRMLTFVVQALGWGDSEDTFYNVAVCLTQAQARKKVAELQKQWLNDNGDLQGCVLRIEPIFTNL